MASGVLASVMANRKFDGPIRPESKAVHWERLVGKTIASVEHGEHFGSRQEHRAEAAVLHFTDGSAMELHIGSNAVNLMGTKVERANDVHLDLMPIWKHSPDVG